MVNCFRSFCVSFLFLFFFFVSVFSEMGLIVISSSPLGFRASVVVGEGGAVLGFYLGVH